MKRLTIFGGLAVVALGLLGGSSAATKLRPGSLDPTFGINGTLVVGQMTYARAIALQPDGKIVVAGWGGLTRFYPDGSVDPSFGNAGVVLTNVSAEAVAVQPDGKIVIGG